MGLPAFHQGAALLAAILSEHCHQLRSSLSLIVSEHEYLVAELRKNQEPLEEVFTLSRCDEIEKDLKLLEVLCNFSDSQYSTPRPFITALFSPYPCREEIRKDRLEIKIDSQPFLTASMEGVSNVFLGSVMVSELFKKLLGTSPIEAHLFDLVALLKGWQVKIARNGETTTLLVSCDD